MPNNPFLHPRIRLFGVPYQCLSFYRRPGEIWPPHQNSAASRHPSMRVSKILASGIKKLMTPMSISSALVRSLLLHC
jgi:hypothetical protein